MPRFLDLTRPLHPDMPRFPTDPPLQVSELESAAADSFEVLAYSFVGPSGTHIDAPSHVLPGGRTLADIPVSDMMLPLIVLTPISDRSAPFLTTADILAWESHHGRVPSGSFAALHTGEPRAGWSLEAVQLLHAREVVAIGHDTLNTDPAELTERGEYPAQRWWLEHDHWQVELLAGLEQVPVTGAHMWVSWPVPAGGSSFPCRAVAVVQD
ncbi:MAG: cyclase family protein [Corynebacterium sp.]|uniref:cyclase family protein n=1 Tax=Corynebacterium sp. TaxID=1720 RepID=UPI0026DF8A05|nr:cyclase family protein [Corynebacterium sp.]MDO5669614.1 cyclase family protein [Corynebacterium sp.]